MFRVILVYQVTPELPLRGKMRIKIVTLLQANRIGKIWMHRAKRNWKNLVTLLQAKRNLRKNLYPVAEVVGLNLSGNLFIKDPD